VTNVAFRERGATPVGPGRLCILVRECTDGRTGALVFTESGEPGRGPRRGLHFRHGVLVAASSSVATERLGESLVRSGRMPLVALVQATTVVSRDHHLLGDVLLQQDLIDPEQLAAGLERHTRETMRRIVTWTTASACFEPRADLDPARVLPRTSTSVQILEAVRGVDDEPALRHLVGDPERRLVRVRRVGPVTLLPSEAAVADALGNGCTAQEALTQSGLALFDAVRALAALLLAGLVAPASVSGPTGG
jgi:hypothetical protein